MILQWGTEGFELAEPAEWLGSAPTQIWAVTKRGLFPGTPMKITRLKGVTKGCVLCWECEGVIHNTIVFSTGT